MTSPAALLGELEAIRTEFGPDMARRKRALLAPLSRLPLGSARDVERLHEALAFLEAFPDNPPLLADVRRFLAGFDRRPDLRRFRRKLADTGIAGTDTFYPFYYPTARWLARRWGDRLRIVGSDFDRAKALEDLLPLLSTIAAIRDRNPGVSVECLISDCKGDPASLATVFDARPDVLNHNIETVARLQGAVRPSVGYARSLTVLARAARAGLVTKSGLIVGMGEESDEVKATLADLAAVGTRIVTIGHYLRPSARHLPLVDFPPYQDGAAPYWQEWLSHPSYDEFWRRVDAVERAERIKVPVLHMTAWYDGPPPPPGEASAARGGRPGRHAAGVDDPDPIRTSPSPSDLTRGTSPWHSPWYKVPSDSPAVDRSTQRIGRCHVECPWNRARGAWVPRVLARRLWR